MLVIYRKSDKKVLHNTGRSFVDPGGPTDQNGKLAVMEQIGGDYEDYGVYRLHDDEDSALVSQISHYWGYITLTFEGEEVVGFTVDEEAYDLAMEEQLLFQQEQERILIAEEAEQQAIKTAIKLAIRIDELTPDELLTIVAMYDDFVPVGHAYLAGDIFKFQGLLYEVIQPHTSQANGIPGEVGGASLYRSFMPEDIIPEWVQPIGAHDAYSLGQKVIFETEVWTSTADNNTWKPGEYGWTKDE